ncbi:Cna B-type domain-containing protein, partial [Gemmiger formicilis]|uniref:Cna B-type domain-containing protein n=1 Tax=Gemmiger formicilis TaxID=745368 RepID=UPI00195E70E3
LVSAVIEGIEMPAAKEITVQTYESRYHDLGLYASQINIPVEKVWNDTNDQDGIRPETVTVTLKANGDDTGKKLTLSKDNNWQGAFSGLDQYLDGKEIDYTVEEVPVTGYQTAIIGSASKGFTITNTHTPETINISGSKTWEDNNNQDGKRPDSITIRLYANGTELTDKVQTVTADNNWKWSFTDLPKYAEGKLIAYTITEDSVDGYTSEVDGFNVTNSHTPEEIDLSGSKTWDDAENQDGKRPDSITIRLYANGEQVKVVTVTADDGWKWNFTNLPKYENGSEIRYTITEDVVPGYQSEVDGMDVTNHYTPGQINISVTKNWQDQDDADGIRPDSITVKLYADGKDTGRELVLDQENDWTGSFDELDEYAGGVKIVYTIAEIEVKGYDTAISGSAETGFVISNSHTPDIPDTPDDPDKPEDPDDPDTPDTPTTPDDPDNPEQPQNPGQPETPDTPKDNIPQTGDTTNLALWVALLAISGTGLIATLIIGKKKRYRGKHMK